MIFDILPSRSRPFFATAAVAVLVISAVPRSTAQQQPPEAEVFPLYKAAALDTATENTTESSNVAAVANDTSAKQSKRILFIFPNYRAVSADTQLPPLAWKEKFWLATQDSFDYSSLITAGLLAGVSQAKNSTPEFGHGGSAYGRYYWHAVTDQAVGNYMTEAIFPTLTHEDPRYYTLGHGGFLKRSRYALTRLLITRTDSSGCTINFSEIIGNGAGAAISNTYYPSRERTWTKTGQKWVAQIGLDGAFNVLKEFWPDINRIIFRSKY